MQDRVVLDHFPPILTRPEVLACFRISAATLRRQIKSKTFPAPWAEGPQRWRRIDLEKFITRRSSKSFARAAKVDALRLFLVGRVHADLARRRREARRA